MTKQKRGKTKKLANKQTLKTSGVKLREPHNYKSKPSTMA